MTPKENLTTDEILAKLDQTSQKTRTISIALTLLLLLILAVVSYFVFKGVKEVGALETKKENLANEVNTLTNIAEGLKASQDDLRSSKTELADVAKDCIENKSNCEKAKEVLAKVDTNVSTTPKPTSSPNTQIPVNNSNPVTKTPTPINNSPSTVYVQIAEEEQRNPAKQKIQQLGGNFKFPGIELVDRKIPKTQVRYFHKEDEGKADDLVKRLGSAGVDATAVFTNIKAPNNLLEIWFANNAFNK